MTLPATLEAATCAGHFWDDQDPATVCSYFGSSWRVHHAGIRNLVSVHLQANCLHYTKNEINI